MAPFAVIGPCFTCVAVSYAKTSAPHGYLTICMAFAWWLSHGGSRVVALAWWLLHGEQTINCAPVVFLLRLLPYTKT